MNKSEGQRDRTPGETVRRMPMGGPTRIHSLLATLGIPRLPGLPEAGAYHRCMPYGSGQEAMMGIKMLRDHLYGKEEKTNHIR